MKGRAGLVALLAAGLAAGCQGQEEGWTPVLEGTPPTFLEREVAGALADVQRARAALPGDPASAAPELESAEDRLSGLAEIYLPLYSAKVAVTNAYRRNALGDAGAALRLADAAVEALGVVNRATDGGLESELRQVVEPLANARLALEAGADAGPELQRAAEKLDDMLTKAGLLR